MDVLVLGAGVAGLGAAVAFAGRGHTVTVAERDASPPPATPEDAFDAWDRGGIAHFRQPHNFLGLARKILLERAPEVLEALRAAGAEEIDQARLIPQGQRQPSDADLVSIACRRPVFEAALRQAALERGDVRMLEGTHVVGLATALDGARLRVTGAVIDGGRRLDADLVVDASGRTTQVPKWLAEAGAPVPEPAVQDCGIVYYSRHFRLRHGADRPEVPSLLGVPRAELDYMTFSMFLGDNRTYSTVLQVPPWDRELRALRLEEPYMRAARAMPALVPWVDPEAAEPISPVLAMGQVRNVFRDIAVDGAVRATGAVPIGDALCHTNPTFAYGASLSLAHAFALADAADAAGDDIDLVERFRAAVAGDALTRFRSVAAEDVTRIRLWRGDPVDPLDPDDGLPLFLRNVVYPASARDPEILRAVARRVNLLAPSNELERDRDLHDRARVLMADVPPPAAPTREELLYLLSA